MVGRAAAAARGPGPLHPGRASPPDVSPPCAKLFAAVPGAEVIRVLERIRLRSLVTLVATVAAAYLLAGELARVSLGHVLRAADIYDRYGHPLAMSIDVDSVFAVPSEVHDKETTAAILGKVSGP